MNLGIIRKTARETLGLLIIVSASIVLFEILFVLAMAEFTEEFAYLWLNKPMFTRFAKLMVGADLGAEVSMTGAMTFGFAHPLLYALTWTFLLTTCSRVIVGEIERGTADLLLTLPVSRGSVYASVTVVWVIAGIPISVFPLVGVWLGGLIRPLNEPVDLARLAIVTVNLFAAYVMIGSVTMLVSSLVSRRGQAVGYVLAVLLSSFLLSFLAMFWSPAERLQFLSTMHYYRPLVAVRSGELPLADLAVLLGLAASCWGLGLWRYVRRDIPAA
ncbi:MAG: ABC transporter permease subunit [bacterium]|nr:ABC transporter permease subunit [bacterium]